MIVKKIYRKLKRIKHKLIQHHVSIALEYCKLHFYAHKHSSHLTLITDNLSKINDNDIILFSVMKNETKRLDFFLNYYRNLGVKHFIFVDNNSQDGFQEFIKNQPDVSAFFTDSSYKDSNFGMHWLNYLLSKYGTNHWCFTCDPDEFIVYPAIESKNLIELTSYLEDRKQHSLYSTMIDMYSKKSVEENIYTKGENPLNICPYYDKTGYRYQTDERHWVKFQRGGVRERVFFPDSPNNSPALNKLPLIKWKKHFVYIASMHMLYPRYLNRTGESGHLTSTLLHFKFISELIDKVEIEMEVKQHWGNSIEYKKYNEVLKNQTLLYEPVISEQYTSWHDFHEHNLLPDDSWTK